MGITHKVVSKLLVILEYVWIAKSQLTNLLRQSIQTTLFWCFVGSLYIEICHGSSFVKYEKCLMLYNSGGANWTINKNAINNICQNSFHECIK